MMQFSEAPGRMRVMESFANVSMSFITGFAMLLFIELVPKPEATRHTLRLLFCLGYFSVAVGWVLNLRRNMPAFIWHLCHWRFESAPPNMEKAWKSMLEELEFALGSLAWIIVGLIGTTGACVLKWWFPLPGMMAATLNLSWWLSIICLVGFAYCIPAHAMAVFKQYRFLSRQIDTCDFYRPRPLSDLWRRSLERADRRVTPREPREGFLAAGRAWKFSRLTENVIAFGGIGSGKTICVMNTFLDELMRSAALNKRTGGLILDFKGDYFGKLSRLAERHTRQHDLVVLSPESGQCWNPLDSDEPAREIAARLVAAMKALGQRDQNTSFFFDQAETFLEHCITLLRISNSSRYPPTLLDIYQLANDAAFLEKRCEYLASSARMSSDRSSPITRCHRFFASEYCTLPEETRQSVVATLNNMLNPLCNETVANMLNGPSTISLSALTTESKILYLHVPAARAPKAGRITGILLKLAFYAEVTKKQLDTDRYTFFFSDEFQEFYTSDNDASDTRFFAVSRQFSHINLVATQSMSNFTMQGETREAVLSLLGNIKTKIFLRNSDQETNEYASSLFGQYVMELGAGHLSGQAQLVPLVHPSDFILLKTAERGVRSFSDCVILNESESKVDLANRHCCWPVRVV